MRPFRLLVNSPLRLAYKKSLRIPKGHSESGNRRMRQNNGQKKKDKQQSTKHTHKTKDRVTRTLQTTGDELKCCGRVGNS